MRSFQDTYFRQEQSSDVFSMQTNFIVQCTSVYLPTLTYLILQMLRLVWLKCSVVCWLRTCRPWPQEKQTKKQNPTYGTFFRFAELTDLSAGDHASELRCCALLSSGFRSQGEISRTLMGVSWNQQSATV